jgi:2'-5' RNA ligase
MELFLSDQPGLTYAMHSVGYKVEGQTLRYKLVNRSNRRLFVALLPSPVIQAQVRAIQMEVGDRYESRAALRSPPHITLQPPFEWPFEELTVVFDALAAFASGQPPLTITLSGFSAFAPRVIYIDVVSSPALLNLHLSLLGYTEQSLGIVDAIGKQRPFAPHMTIAFRDLTRQNFYIAWAAFQNRPFQAQFLATHLTLLMHDGQRWNVKQQLPLQNSHLLS